MNATMWSAFSEFHQAGNVLWEVFKGELFSILIFFLEYFSYVLTFCLAHPYMVRLYVTLAAFRVIKFAVCTLLQPMLSPRALWLWAGILDGPVTLVWYALRCIVHVFSFIINMMGDVISQLSPIVYMLVNPGQNVNTPQPSAGGMSSPLINIPPAGSPLLPAPGPSSPPAVVTSNPVNVNTDPVQLQILQTLQELVSLSRKRDTIGEKPEAFGEGSQRLSSIFGSDGQSMNERHVHWEPLSATEPSLGHRSVIHSDQLNLEHTNTSRTANGTNTGMSIIPETPSRDRSLYTSGPTTF